MSSPPFLTAPQLARLPGIGHGFFTRAGGVSDGIYASLNCGLGSADDRGKVSTNRGRVAAAMGARPDELVTPYQVHGTETITVDVPWANDARPKADAVPPVWRRRFALLRPEHDGGKLAPVVLLAAVGGAAEGEEACLIGIRANAETGRAHSGALQSRHDVPPEVEQRPPVAPVDKSINRENISEPHQREPVVREGAQVAASWGASEYQQMTQGKERDSNPEV